MGKPKRASNVSRKWLSHEAIGGGLTTKKSMRITIETQSQLVIHLGSARFWCEHCASEVEMVSLGSAAEVPQAEAKAIEVRVDNERLHSPHSHGPVRTCLNSLLKRLKKFGDPKTLHRFIGNSDLKEPS
jgi:hypothetical protein